MAVNYQRLLRRLDKKLSQEASEHINSGVSNNSSRESGSVFHQKLSNILMHHRNNLANPQQFKDPSDKSQSVKERQDLQEFGITPPQNKMKRKNAILSDSESPTAIKEESKKTESKISEKRKSKNKTKLV